MLNIIVFKKIIRPIPPRNPVMKRILFVLSLGPQYWLMPSTAAGIMSDAESIIILNPEIKEDLKTEKIKQYKKYIKELTDAKYV